MPPARDACGRPLCLSPLYYFHSYILQMHALGIVREPYIFTRESCSCTRFSLAEILVLAGTSGAGGKAPLASTRISARLQYVQGHDSRVNIMELYYLTAFAK